MTQSGHRLVPDPISLTSLLLTTADTITAVTVLCSQNWNFMFSKLEPLHPPCQFPFAVEALRCTHEGKP
jgi:hypothetical protein